MLKARLYEYEMQKKRKKIKELSVKTDIGWGHQIQSMYCLSTSKRFKE